MVGPPREEGRRQGPPRCPLGGPVRRNDERGAVLTEPEGRGSTGEAVTTKEEREACCEQGELHRRSSDDEGGTRSSGDRPTGGTTGGAGTRDEDRVAVLTEPEVRQHRRSKRAERAAQQW